MKSVAENFAFNVHASGCEAAGPIDALLLDRIGDDLRHRYAELTDAEMPHRLLALAEAIDRRRAGDGIED